MCAEMRYADTMIMMNGTAKLYGIHSTFGSIFQIQCKVNDIYTDREIDLTPLKSTTHNYLARLSDPMKATQPKGVLVCLYFYHFQCRIVEMLMFNLAMAGIR